MVHIVCEAKIDPVMCIAIHVEQRVTCLGAGCHHLFPLACL